MYDVCTLYVVAQPGDDLKKKKLFLESSKGIHMSWVWTPWRQASVSGWLGIISTADATRGSLRLAS